ncbi:hypothetical protein Phum_PHUM055910 [Pediculus humanus corporis]|uniref:Cyclic nucleotide-binding domain-containing protein n=1 Tax=Pediculus humanus subsp. corporis TaxID=121224 RepID=E0VBA9_PEDHC|nr:uncharacterized protein Phum_PHUM055910 [Pediculus humanus corporis]EEB10665.1 hypothetical protein Phum_PHUM055910 [Pediculus humanus corporis]
MSEKKILTIENEEIKRALSLFPYFDTWDDNVIVKCCQVSAIIEFPPDKIIKDANSSNAQMTFFILEGTSKIIYKLQVLKKKDSFGEYSSILLNTNEITGEEETNLMISGTNSFENEKKPLNLKNEGEKTNEECREKLEKIRKKPNKTILDLKKEKNVETIFMEVAFFRKGGCFGLGENWIKMKRKLSEKATLIKNIPNYTLDADVPFSLRLMEIPIE